MKPRCIVPFLVLCVFPFYVFPRTEASSQKNVSRTCTIFSATSAKKIFFSGNLDHPNLDGYVRFIPASKEGFGGVLHGYQAELNGRVRIGFENGMNERGLAFSTNGLPDAKMKSHPEKKLSWSTDNFWHRMMRKCATVEDAMKMAKDFNFGTIMDFQVHVADSKGGAVVIGPGPDGEVIFTRKKKADRILVSTNFNNANPEHRHEPYPCKRYLTATKMLISIEDEKDLNLDFLESILDEVHFEGASYNTIYSYVCDLKNGSFHIYYFHQFEESVAFDLKKQLAEEERTFKIRDLFSQETQNRADREYERYKGKRQKFSSSPVEKKASTSSDLPRYKSYGEAGFSEEKMQLAKDFFDNTGPAVTAVAIVYKGKTLLGWGDVVFPFACHSVRKSLLSALYGIHVEEGNIDLEKTLADLNVKDSTPLTEAEKQAKVIHLLKARSGVYIPAAAETGKMRDSRPKRGSHAPDTFFHYNNWDFNVLGTIFKQETGKDIFEEFKIRIADPIGMQEFDPDRCYYYYEREYSDHPMYGFRMSTRDRARMGLLYLQRGRWGDKQIITEKWVEESTRLHSSMAGLKGVGYGYMWIVIAKNSNIYELAPPYKELKYMRNYDFHFASGHGGQLIMFVPEIELVYAVAADTEVSVPPESMEAFQLLDKILKAGNL